MLIKFVKKCPLSFQNRVKVFEKGNAEEFAEDMALQLIKAGYAVEKAVSEEIVSSVEETVSEKSEEIDVEARLKHWKGFSFEKLKELCDRYEISLPESGRLMRRNLAQALADYEKERGRIIEVEENEQHS